MHTGVRKFLTFVSRFDNMYILRMREGLSFQYLERDVLKGHNMQRSKSNVTNLSFTITNPEAEDSKGRATKTQGLEVTQTLINGRSVGVGIRTINGKQKSSQVKLDRAALEDVLAAVQEVLETEGE